MTGRWELNDEQWAVVEPVLWPARRTDGRGRPWHDTRSVLRQLMGLLVTFWSAGHESVTERNRVGLDLFEKAYVEH